jgi:phenylpyruvate tautomerase PptA (4-oxalocrotonate tautomerase family)
MPMIDVYATDGTSADPHALAQELAETLMRIEEVPAALPMFRQNSAAFVHSLPDGAIANVEGEGDYVRVQVLTNLGLDRPKQLAVVEQFTHIVAAVAGRAELRERTWVLLTETPDGGWGLWGHAHTNAELVAAARAEAAKLSG